MTLTKYKIGSLITVIDERNVYGIRKFYGININKEFMPTIANTDSLDEKKYKVVRKNRFVYSGMQTGRDECIRISMYMGDDTIIVSPAYITFEVTKTDVVDPTYFFMLFLSKEKDRLGWFYSDSSIRANLDWDVFCDIELNLPPVSVQQKYVNIYNAMLDNQKCYEQGLEDLKLTLDFHLDKLKSLSQKLAIGEILEDIDIRNTYNIYTKVYGVNINKQFMLSVASSKDVHNYKIVQRNQFVYSGMQTGRDECIRIALHDKETSLIVSPAYSVLRIKNNIALPEYIQMWFSRTEMDRMGWFMSDSSIRSNLDLPRFFEIMIPVPDIKVQQYLVDIYNAYQLRMEISTQLKLEIKEMCPILIKGSLE